MRILYYELRKIWRLPVVLAIIFLGAVHYFLFLDFEIRFFPNGHPAAEKYALAQEWTIKYGSTMEPDEYADAKQNYAALAAEADARIAADSRFRAHGFSRWEQLRDGVPEEYRDTYDLLFTGEFDFVGYRLQSLSGALLSYETQILHPRVQRESGRGIFPGQCIDNLSEYLCWTGIFGIVSVTILLGACGTREDLCRMPAMLWSSRAGRHTAWYQLAAALLSASILFAAELLIFGGIYARLGTQFFWDSPVQSFLNGSAVWFGLTYGQYVLYCLGFVLALMLGTAGAVFTLSHSSGNYTSAIMKALPLAAGMVFAAASILMRPFTDGNELYRHLHICGVEAVLCGPLLLAGLGIGFLFVRHIQRKELL